MLLTKEMFSRLFGVTVEKAQRDIEAHGSRWICITFREGKPQPFEIMEVGHNYVVLFPVFGVLE
jgi:hypothetical protein